MMIPTEMNRQADDPAPTAPLGPLPFFAVGTHKFIVLSIFTLGLYDLYWSYRNWKQLKSVSGDRVSPFWRAFFAPFWAVSLFNRVHDAATAAGVRICWRAGPLGILYLILSMTWRLPDPWWLISLASFIPIIPVQLAAQRINARHGAFTPEARNERTAQQTSWPSSSGA